MTEFCIMDDNPPYWRNHREEGLHRHEIMYGTANRKKSIEDGLVVFLTPERHNMSKDGVHFNKQFDNELKRVGEETWCYYYNKTTDDFIKRYGRNYIDGDKCN